MVKKIILLLFIFLTACQSNNPIVENNLENSSTSTPIPTPEERTGNAFGKFIDSKTGKPYEASLFFSKNLTSDYPGYPPLITFSYQTNPRASQDDFGNFVFKNIPPGQYVIVVYHPTGQKFISDKETNNPIMYTIKEGEILDLGTILYP